MLMLMRIQSKIDEWEQTSVLMVAEDAVEYGGKAVSSGKPSLVMEDSIYIVSNAQLRQDMFADIALEITNIVENIVRGIGQTIKIYMIKLLRI